jgi:tight adherence protein B
MQLVPRRETLEILLYRAGMPISMHRFVLVSAVFAAAGWMGASALTDDMRLGSIGLGACLVPWLVVRHIAGKRMAEFESQFPDALELLTRAMRAGHSLGIGFQLVGEELADPVGSEFACPTSSRRF